MDKIRQLIRILLTLALCLAQLPESGFAQNDVLEGTLEAEFEDYETYSILRHYLITPSNERLELKYPNKKHQRELRTGTRIQVRGRRAGREIMLADGFSTPVDILAVADEAAPIELQALVILVNFADDTRQPFTPAFADSLMFGTVNQYYQEASFNQHSLNGQTTPWMTLAISGTQKCDSVAITNSARAAATAAGYNLSLYSRHMIAFPQQSCLPWAGLGNVGGNPSRSLINGSFVLRTVAHELGHNNGLSHAKALNCNGVTLLNDTSSCTVVEYGDPWDIMGVPGRVAHFNAAYKQKLGWLSAQNVTTSGSYDINPIESVSSSVKGIKVTFPFGAGGNTYYLEFRQPIGFDSTTGPGVTAFNGLLIHRLSGTWSEILDTAPGTVGDFWDAPLKAGQTYRDPLTNGSITVESVTPAALRVNIQFSGTPADTTAPTISLTAPAPGATVSGPAISVSASASDNVGVVGVQFILDGASLGAEDTSAPYVITWNSTLASNGAHTVTAVARDAAGNIRTSSAVNVTVDNAAPVISSVNSTVLGTSSATITWTTNETADTQVEYGLTTAYGQSTTLAAALVTAHSQTLSSLTANTLYNYRVKSRDAQGNLATSGNFTFTTQALPGDSTLPTVAITAPASGATVSGSAVTVAASASDNIGVVGVQFKLDGVNLGAEDASAPYAITWNSALASNGSHSLTAVARDAAGNTKTSSAVNVTVNNTAPGDTTLPTVAITAPTSGATVSGPVNITAVASDNVGVVGVQFELNGANLFAEDVTPPYTIAWNTPFAANGAYSLTAVARDAAGNTKTSSAVNVTVNNAATSPPPTEISQPALDLPDYLPVDAVIRVSNGDNAAIAYFVWTFTPQTNSPSTLGDRSLPSSASSQAAGPASASINTPSPALNLATVPLVPGLYLISLKAFDAVGNASAEAQDYVTLVPADLSSVRIYPNPWRADRHAGKPIVFDNLTINSSAKIFTVSGHAVKTLPTNNVRLTWDLTNEGGEKIGSGIYLYTLITEQGRKRTGKIVIIK
jgi:hypothetical protein